MKMWFIKDSTVPLVEPQFVWMKHWDVSDQNAWLKWLPLWQPFGDRNAPLYRHQRRIKMELFDVRKCKNFSKFWFGLCPFRPYPFSAIVLHLAENKILLGFFSLTNFWERIKPSEPICLLSHKDNFRENIRQWGEGRWVCILEKTSDQF